MIKVTMYPKSIVKIVGPIKEEPAIRIERIEGKLIVTTENEVTIERQPISVTFKNPVTKVTISV